MSGKDGMRLYRLHIKSLAGMKSRSECCGRDGPETV